MLHKAIPDKERLAGARALELDGATEEAVEAYQRVLKGDPLNVMAIGRLLIIYRRQKEYQLELALLKASIAAYEAVQLTAQEAWRKKHQKAARISMLLAKKLEGGTKKGPVIYDDRLVTGWRRRKGLVMKRMKGEGGKGLKIVGKGVKDRVKGLNKRKQVKDRDEEVKGQDKQGKGSGTTELRIVGKQVKGKRKRSKDEDKRIKGEGRRDLKEGGSSSTN
jgi:hypothetical protein